MTQLTEDLQKAYDHLEAHGWCQGYFAKEDGKVCLDGALRKGAQDDTKMPAPWSTFYTDSSYPARLCAVQEQLAKAIKLDFESVSYEGAPDYRVIWDWNDDPERSVEDVKLVLKKSIADSEEVK